MKKCPFCAEEIQEEAIKCRHCKSELKPTTQSNIQFSETARDISQGLKKKEFDDIIFNWQVFFFVIIGAILGFAFSSWPIFIITTLSGIIWLSVKYYKR